MNRTPWFQGSTPPVRHGWYECKFDGVRGITRMHWDGEKWHYNPDVPKVNLLGDSFGTWPGDRWRGLEQETNAE